MFRRQQPRTISGHTLEEVVRRYLNELENPAPDFSMREIYREWMREFLEEDK